MEFISEKRYAYCYSFQSFQLTSVLLTFLFSSQVPLGHFQSDLAQSIFGLKGFQFKQMFPRGVNRKNTLSKFFKAQIFFYRTERIIGLISTKHSWVKLGDSRLFTGACSRQKKKLILVHNNSIFFSSGSKLAPVDCLTKQRLH